MIDVIKKIAKAIRGTEFEGNAFIVGGYVRDKIMGKASNDLDIVVARDNGGVRLAAYLHEKGIGSNPVIFKNFGTAFVLIEEYKVEFVMTRQESYRGTSRKPDVKAGSIEDDVYRRDFTINSLLMDIGSGKIIDITGSGLDDIDRKIIRATSEPNKLFSDDPLRMLRAVRFSVQLGFDINSNTYDVIKQNAGTLKNISWERRRDELQKIVTSGAPSEGIRRLFDLKLIENLIPELIKLKGFQQNKYHYLDVLDHTLVVLDNCENNLILRLAAIFHDIAKPVVATQDQFGVHFYGHNKKSALMADVILRRLRFPLGLINRVKQLVINHMRLKNSGEDGELISDKGIRRLMLEMGSDLELLFLLIDADNKAHAEGYRLENQIEGIRQRVTEIKIYLTKPESPVKGRDVIEKFSLNPGKRIGELLGMAEELWLDNPQYDKDEILEELKKNLEGTMADVESKVTKSVRDGVNKALELGEDFVQALCRVTKEVVHTVKEEDLSTKEKVNKLANEALEGAKQGAKSIQPQTEEFVKKASKSIVDSIKVAAPKVAHFAQEALVGMYEGAKDYYDQKKEDKTTEETPADKE